METFRPSSVLLFLHLAKAFPSGPVHEGAANRYYNATFLENDQLWVDLDSMDPGFVEEPAVLAKAYQRATPIPPLSFDFPFYGHNVTNVTVTTQGFLFVGDIVHRYLAATQYIAPLMAAFDARQNDNAKIRYADNGTAFIVEWKDVHLKSADNESSTDPFSFQAILRSDGDIAFVYKAVPVAITAIEEEDHPVKVGLSDAYSLESTIHEYHRLDLKDHNTTSASTIYLTPLPTCNIKTDCQSCIGTNVEAASGDWVSLNCTWCPLLNRCSDGMDRLRQEWLDNSCDENGDSGCSVISNAPNATTIIASGL